MQISHRSICTKSVLFKKILFREFGAVGGAALAEEFVGVVGLLGALPCARVGYEDPAFSVRESFYKRAGSGKSA